MTDGSGKNRRVAAVVCRAGNLTDALAESLRVEVHRQLAVVTEWDNPIGYRLTGRAL
jgi:hypothetical protein